MTSHSDHIDAPDVRLDSENDVVVGPFFTALADKLAEPGLVAALHERHRNLRQPLTDTDSGPTAQNAAVATALLAADQTLSPTVPHRGERRQLLEQALVEPLEDTIRHATETALDAADDPFAAMVATTRVREKHAFGPRFVFEHPVDDDTEFVSEVRHCYFHELLTAHDAGHLTSVLCAFDANWMGAVDPDRHGFTVDRMTSIATGGESCPFRFRRNTTG